MNAEEAAKRIQEAGKSLADAYMYSVGGLHKYTHVLGTRLVECECGVWKVDDMFLPCWNHTKRKQLMVEAIAQLRQAIRNLGYEILHAVKLA